MDSPQSVVSPFKNSSVFADTEKMTADLFNNGLGFMSRGLPGHVKDNKAEDSIGVLQVFVHRARDIHNICIYHKQDVYAKLCLTSDPENAASTKVINGGGQNPVFNDTVRLNVCTLDTSLKCEIWMLSRVRNYLEDQLLGFALVPLSEIVVDNGKLEKEFSLSSTDLLHSPAGYVQLSIAYNGTLPDVIVMSSLPSSTIADEGEALGSFDLDKIEFPDPEMVKEEQLMVSECFGVPYSELISRSSDSFSSDTENQLNSEAGVQLVESFSAGTMSPGQFTKHDSSPSSGSAAAYGGGSYSSETPRASKSSKDDDYSSPSKEIHKEKSADSSGNESDSSFVKPVITVNLESEQKVVQQDIVDMYMKSMQQFTESLAKMKLPLDIDNNPTLSGDSTTDRKLQGSNNSGGRVFYGSRAFF